VTFFIHFDGGLAGPARPPSKCIKSYHYFKKKWKKIRHKWKKKLRIFLFFFTKKKLWRNSV